MFGNRKMQGPKYFKGKPTYYTHFLIYAIWIGGICWTFLFFSSFSEERIREVFIDQELIGAAKQRMSGAFQEFLVRKFGKNGILGLTIGGLCFILYLSYNDITEFLRYLRKERLFKQGLVDNMFDDHRPKSFFQLIKGIFNKTDKGNPKRRFKDIGKLQKDLERDKLYQKLYGKK